MSESDIAVLTQAASAYESLHVPALFAEWTGRVLDAAHVTQGQRVLDVACGTGVLAREALARVGNGGSVAGLDPNEGMLAVAGQLAPGVSWHLGTAEALPFQGGAFDAVVSQFGMMFFGDRTAAVREMLRVTRPGGSLAVAVWGSLEESPAYREEVELLQHLAGQEAADALRAPFVLGDEEEFSQLFDQPGAAGVRVVSKTGLARFPSVRVMVEADLRGWLPVMGVVLHEDLIQKVLIEAETVLAPYVREDRTVVFECPALIAVARKAA